LTGRFPLVQFKNYKKKKKRRGGKQSKKPGGKRVLHRGDFSNIGVSFDWRKIE